MPKLKPFEELTIADDYWFKRLMSDKKLCIKLLEIILEVKILTIRYVEGEKSLKPGYLGKGIRLDVFVEDDNHTVYNIEMQVRSLPTEELTRRLRYYQSVIDTQLLKSGNAYADMKESRIICICPFKVFDGKRHKYTLKTYCKENKKLAINDGAMKIILSTKGEEDDVSQEVKEFLEYVEGKITPGNDFIEELEKKSKELKERESERVGYMTFGIKLFEERQKGRIEGRIEGEKIGTQKGRREGEQKVTKLITHLIKDGKSDEIQKIAVDAKLRRKLYKHYGI